MPGVGVAVGQGGQAARCRVGRRTGGACRRCARRACRRGTASPRRPGGPRSRAGASGPVPQPRRTAPRSGAMRIVWTSNGTRSTRTDHPSASSSPASPDGPSAVVWHMAEMAVTPWRTSRSVHAGSADGQLLHGDLGQEPEQRLDGASRRTRPVGAPSAPTLHRAAGRVASRAGRSRRRPGRWWSRRRGGRRAGSARRAGPAATRPARRRSGAAARRAARRRAGSPTTASVGLGRAGPVGDRVEHVGDATGTVEHELLLEDAHRPAGGGGRRRSPGPRTGAAEVDHLGVGRAARPRQVSSVPTATIRSPTVASASWPAGAGLGRRAAGPARVEAERRRRVTAHHAVTTTGGATRWSSRASRSTSMPQPGPPGQHEARRPRSGSGS